MATRREGADREVPAPLRSWHVMVQCKMPRGRGLCRCQWPHAGGQKRPLVDEMVCKPHAPAATTPSPLHRSALVPSGLQSVPLLSAGCSAQPRHAWPADGTATTLPMPVQPTGAGLRCSAPIFPFSHAVQGAGRTGQLPGGDRSNSRAQFVGGNHSIQGTALHVLRH